jgi:4-hydroxy-tetrahydrodipicolinate reductase
MGQLVEMRAGEEGHEVVITLTSRDRARDVDELAEALSRLDAVIDFSVADAVPKNAAACAQAGVPLVEGTTGWGEQKSEVCRTIEEGNGALVYGANFSIGVQIFSRIVAHASELFREVEMYSPFIEEAHHARKRDAPSGTALQLREIMTSRLERDVPVASTRAGYIPGTHRVGFDSPADQLTLTHTARSREGFASGALMAARLITGRRGVYEFSKLFDEMLKERRDGK